MAAKIPESRPFRVVLEGDDAHPPPTTCYCADPVLRLLYDRGDDAGTDGAAALADGEA